jgi:hypothetical protein
LPQGKDPASEGFRRRPSFNTSDFVVIDIVAKSPPFAGWIGASCAAKRCFTPVDRFGLFWRSIMAARGANKGSSA